MIALVDKYGEIYQLKHGVHGFNYAAIFGSVEEAVKCKIACGLKDARIIHVKVR